VGGRDAAVTRLHPQVPRPAVVAPASPRLRARADARDPVVPVKRLLARRASAAIQECPGTPAAILPNRAGHAARVACRGTAAGAPATPPAIRLVETPGPGQARGNNLNLNGGLWHQATVSGPAVAADPGR
jgi:hypothetical protein